MKFDDVPHVGTVRELKRAFVACFVAEAVERAMTTDSSLEGFDPRDAVEHIVEDELSRSATTKDGPRAAVDRLAALARRGGHDLDRIAANVDRMRAAIDGVEALH